MERTRKRYLSTLAAVVWLSSAAAVSAQWTNRYPKVQSFAHQLYLEQEHLPILSSGPVYPAPSPDGAAVAFAHQGWIWLLDSGRTTLQLPEGDYRIVAAHGLFSIPQTHEVRVQSGRTVAASLNIAQIWDERRDGFVLSLSVHLAV